ncbi:hypothetical protein QUB68_11580 [Microcoleus sp. A006_D1]|uniref:hypothetical protein n=1 Tax=Microcoleus sp. A006_D1 TaxID=3055267 RepID=UPI002FCF6A2F
MLAQECVSSISAESQTFNRAREIWYEGELRHTSIGHEAEIRTVGISPDSQSNLYFRFYSNRHSG